MKEKIKSVFGRVLLVCFIAMMIIGYHNGEAKLVMTKAVNICLECIGID